MELKPYSVGYISDEKSMDIISKVGTLAFVGDIGADKDSVADFYEVNPRTVERILEQNRDEFLRYGDFRKTRKQIKNSVTDKSVVRKISRKTNRINLFNRKHIMLFACYLNHYSEVAKQIVHYLIQVESSVSMETKIDALLRCLVQWDSLPSEYRSSIYMQTINELRKARGLVAFAESVGESPSLISVNDFAKSTYGTLGLGQKKLFREMRFNGILNSQNRPYQYYVNAGYFEVITKVINGKVIYQTKVTGKGQVWLLNRMKRILGI